MFSPLLHSVVNQYGCITHIFSQGFGIAAVRIKHITVIKGFAAVYLGQYLVFAFHVCLEQYWKIFCVQEVNHLYPSPRRFIGIGRAYTAAGGAYLVVALALFLHLIKL